MSFALSCWRLFPFIIIIGNMIWALLMATQHEGYNIRQRNRGIGMKMET